MPKQKAQKLEAEERLYQHWQQTCDPNDFQAILGQGNIRPDTRPPGLDLEEVEWLNAPVGELKTHLARLIFGGYALSFVEFHLARAFHFILRDLPYEQFFMTRWHETATHRAYCAPAECPACRHNQKGP